MASGFRRKRGEDEYLFIDGKAMRADEVLRIDVGPTAVPGQEEAQAARDAQAQVEAGLFARSRASMRALSEDDAFGLRETSTAVPGGPTPDEGEQDGESGRPRGVSKYDDRLMYEDRRQIRRKTLVIGGLLLVAILVSLCVSYGYSYRIYSPIDVVQCYGQWFRLRFIQIFDPVNYTQARFAVLQTYSMYGDVCSQVLQVFKYVFCGILLAVAGMLYQNTFRNPIAAPSMLGVSNGTSIALLIMVLIFGSKAESYANLYYAFSFIGGGVMLLLVIFGGKWISGNGKFNVVNMLLMGTILSQLSGVIMTYVQNYVFTDEEWLVYYDLQNASTTETYWVFVIIAICTVVTFIPVVLYRFQLNLVSFTDAETKLLGIDPDRLRSMALICGSLMVLTAQVSAGQVSMMSLVVPFVARAAFGAEFRKQLVGTCLIGALLMLLCGDLSTIIYFDETVPINLGSIVTVVMLPLFVWIMAVQQRAWE